MTRGLVVDDSTDHLPIFTLYNLENVPKQETFVYRRKFNNDVDAVQCEA